MKVERIDHVTFFVRDLDKASKFFATLLGTEFSEPSVNEEFSYRQTMEPLGMELLESTSPDGFIAKTIERKGEGVALVGLKVPNLEEAITEMESQGVRLISRIEEGQMKTAQFHPKDTYGVVIELVEYKVKHPIITAMRGQA